MASVMGLFLAVVSRSIWFCEPSLPINAYYPTISHE